MSWIGQAPPVTGLRVAQAQTDSTVKVINAVGSVFVRRPAKDRGGDRAGDGPGGQSPVVARTMLAGKRRPK